MTDVLSSTNQAILALIQGVLPAMTAIVGGIWVAFTFLENQKAARVVELSQAARDNSTRLIEARKPFLDKQWALYIETAQVVGALIGYQYSYDTQKPDEMWNANWLRFHQLYWAELALVMDAEVQKPLDAFLESLEPVPNTPPSTDQQYEELRKAGRELSFALHRSIQKGWPT